MIEILKIATISNAFIYLFDYFYFSRRTSANPYYQYSFNEQIIHLIYLLIIPIVSEFYGLIVLSAVYIFIVKYVSFNIVANMTIGYKYLYLFLGVDFIHYVIHRLQHTYKFFWEVHKVHHSSTHFNFGINYRISIFEGLNNIPIPIFAALSGFTFREFAIFNIIYLSYMGWTHMSVPKIKWLEYFFATPSNHRVHHWLENEGKCNYGGVLIIWDHLFKTYKEENLQDYLSPKKFGIKRVSNSNSSIIIENIPYLNSVIKKINYHLLLSNNLFFLAIQSLLLKLILSSENLNSNQGWQILVKLAYGAIFLLALFNTEIFKKNFFRKKLSISIIFILIFIQILGFFLIHKNGIGLKLNPGLFIFVFTFITVIIEKYKKLFINLLG